MITKGRSALKVVVAIAIVVVLAGGASKLIPSVGSAISGAVEGAISGAVAQVEKDLGYSSHNTSEKPTVVGVDARHLAAVDVRVLMQDTVKTGHSSHGHIYSWALNFLHSPGGDLPVRAVVFMHLRPDQVAHKTVTKIPSQHVVMMDLPQPSATKDDVLYVPQDLKNVHLGALDELGAAFFNTQVKTSKVYEDERPVLANKAMATPRAMKQTRDLIGEVAQGWIDGLPGYIGYKVVIHWTGIDPSTTI